MERGGIVARATYEGDFTRFWKFLKLGSEPGIDIITDGSRESEASSLLDRGEPRLVIFLPLAVVL